MQSDKFSTILGERRDTIALRDSTLAQQGCKVGDGSIERLIGLALPAR
jgi:hypothetical protein